MTIQAAIVSQDTFALDDRNLYLPGLITYEDGPGGGFVLTITPIGSTDLDLGVVEVIIGSADLQALRAMRDRHTDDDDAPAPSNSSDPADCYDCSTNQTRLDTLDAEYVTLCQAIDALKNWQRIHSERLEEIEKRVDALETKNASLTVHMNQVPNAVRRIDELERQIKNLAAATNWDRVMGLLQQLDPPPPGHRHDGGHWITCPFCVDDKLGMCSACDGTRRIWDMPPEGGA
jgi:hypothetical protein